MSDFFDVREMYGYTTAIVYDNGEIDEISTHFVSGAAARAIVGGSYGFTTADDPSKAKEAIETAIQLAKRLDRINPRKKIEMAPIPKGGKEVYRVKKNPGDVSMSQKQDLLKSIEDAMRERDKNGLIKSTRLNYSEAFSHNIHYTSSGERIEYDMYRTGFSCSAVAGEGSALQVGRRSYFNVGGFEIFDQCDPVELAREAVDEVYALLSAKPAPSGKFDVICDPELAGVFIHEAVGHASEADTVLDGDSCLEGRIGQQIGSELVTVKDDPTLLKYGYYPYDSEGVPSHSKTLIENGVMKAYLNSRETAAKLGGAPGNARAGGLARPVVRMSNTFIDNGELSKDEVFEGVNGIYLKGSRGGQVNTGEGVFQFNAVMGYLLKDGKIGDCIRDVSLSGNTLKTLNNIVRVGNDLDFHSGRCGKAGQGVPVGDGSPHILIKDAVVGGSS
ncbi:TldD/PmbA family protein [Methanocella arvoryzae]|uniref:Peptidase (U62 family) n=1 Tax=Methanocella arvoryzae (strain DSM 22066 / NBRC 105507 / MRE50) TaxID=351160 RepID=Q0W6X3_METAR|nr:TldD/PmbA family protein [Methanocella arvoryzae]CAJ35870.1 putative peptidase (U62 family) [Methanocella arvoryzae MRE50]